MERKLRSKDAVWLCDTRKILQMCTGIFIACCLRLCYNSDAQFLLCRVYFEYIMFANKTCCLPYNNLFTAEIKKKRLICISETNVPKEFSVIISVIIISKLDYFPGSKEKVDCSETDLW